MRGHLPPQSSTLHDSPLSLQRLQSGTTGVCALITGANLHVAWLGDSQVILVQQGQVVKLMEPHKPERQVRGTLRPSLRHSRAPVALDPRRGPKSGTSQGSGMPEGPSSVLLV